MSKTDKADVVIDIFSQALKPGDRVLLCSDGLTEMVPDDYIQNIILRSESPQMAVEQLIGKANQESGHDNITTIVIKAE